MEKVKIEVLYGIEWQKKVFKDEISAVEWCRRNYYNIGCINDTYTNYEVTSHFGIMRAIRRDDENRIGRCRRS